MEVLSRQEIYQVNGGAELTRLVVGGIISSHRASIGSKIDASNSDHTHPVEFISPVIIGTAAGITTMLFAGNRPTANALAISATSGAVMGFLRRRFSQ